MVSMEDVNQNEDIDKELEDEEFLNLDPLQVCDLKIKKNQKSLKAIVRNMEIHLEQEIYPHLADKHGIRVHWDDDYLYINKDNWEDRWYVCLWSCKDKKKTQQIKKWYEFNKDDKEYKQCEICNELYKYYSERGMNDMDGLRISVIEKIEKEQGRQRVLIRGKTEMIEKSRQNQGKI